MTELNTAYQVWRQFAPGEKVSGVRATSQLRVTAPDIPHSTPLSDSFAGLRQAAGQAINANLRSQAIDSQTSKQKAENWMKSVSPEEFRKAAQEGNLPFQDDPIAMARLRYLHGFNAGVAVQNQIASNIQSGHYKDELDAEGNVLTSASSKAVEDYYAQMKSMRTDIAKTVGFAEDDTALTNGMFRDAERQISTITGLQTQETDRRNRAQAKILHSSGRNALLSQAVNQSPDFAAGVAEDSWKQGYETGVYKDLPDLLRDVGSTLDQVAGKPNGLQTIDRLLTAKVPGTSQTVRDFYDGDELENFRQKALNHQIKTDAEANLNWNVQVQNLQDDPNGLTGLFQLHQEEVQRSGGSETARSRQLTQEISQKKRTLAVQAAKLQTENAKAQLQGARVAVLTQEAGRYLAGNLDAQSYEVMPKDPELGAYTKEDALLMERGLLERYQAQPEKLLKLAAYMPNGYIANTVKDYWKDTTASMEVDASRISKGLMRPEDIKEPAALASMNTLKKADPLAFRKVIGGDTEAIAKLDSLERLGAMGLSYKDMVLGQANWHKLDEKERKTQTRGIEKVLKDEAIRPKYIGKNDSLKNLGGSEYAQTYMRTMVNGLMTMGIPQEDALKKADAAFSQYHVGLNGFPIPTSFFSDVRAEDQVNAGMDVLAESLADYAIRNGIKPETVMPDYVPGSGSLLLRAPGKTPLTILAADLQQGAKALSDKRREAAILKNAEGAEKAIKDAAQSKASARSSIDALNQAASSGL
jgi:hypothetical protein